MPRIHGYTPVLITDKITTAGVEPTSTGIYVSRAIHSRIEQSNMWVASYVWATVAAAASIFFHIKVGSNKNPHGVMQLSSAAKVTYYIYENPLLTNDGTALDNVCENRQTTAVSDTACFRDPTITANGLQLEIGMFGSAGKFTAVGSTIDNGGYFMLKKNESYLIRIDNDDAEAQDIAITYMWHEE